MGNYGRNRPLYDAFIKYGIDNFAIEEICECPNEELNQREKEYIKLYHSYIGNNDCRGYNATVGGDGTTMELSASELETMISLYQKGATIKEIHDIIGYDVHFLVKKLKQLGFKCHSNRRPVYQIDIKTNQIIN